MDGGSGMNLHEVRYYVFDDRKMYRPGETVSIKGWMRRIERGPEGDVGLFPEGAAPFLDYTVRDSSNNLIGTGEISVNALGGFHFQFELPENVNLGYAWIELRSAYSDFDEDEARHGHLFQIQEFRRPEFEVGAAVSEGPTSPVVALWRLSAPAILPAAHCPAQR